MQYVPKALSLKVWLFILGTFCLIYTFYNAVSSANEFTVKYRLPLTRDKNRTFLVFYITGTITGTLFSYQLLTRRPGNVPWTSGSHISNRIKKKPRLNTGFIQRRKTWRYFSGDADSFRVVLFITQDISCFFCISPLLPLIHLHLLLSLLLSLFLSLSRSPTLPAGLMIYWLEVFHEARQQNATW